MKHLLGIISIFALLIHTLVLGVVLYCGILLKIISPHTMRQKYADPLINSIASLWLSGILWWIKYVFKTEWRIEHEPRYEQSGWFLITANHQSWVDIFALYAVYHRKIPYLKFFIKHELAYIPIVGQAWWALDYPFMKRYSKEYLTKYPHKAGEDLKATQDACRKFSTMPTAIVNFLEGTRITPEKYAQQRPRFKNLLNPKAGGLAFAMQALGDKFSHLSVMTIVYPDGIPTFWQLLCGDVKRVHISPTEIEIPQHFSSGDYQNDKALRLEIQSWVNTIWSNMDDRIEAIKQSYDVEDVPHVTSTY